MRINTDLAPKGARKRAGFYGAQKTRLAGANIGAATVHALGFVQDHTVILQYKAQEFVFGFAQLAGNACSRWYGIWCAIHFC